MKSSFLRRRQPVVDELAGLAPIDGARIRFAQATDGDHGLGGEVAEEPGTRAAAADLRQRRRLQVAAEQSRCGGSQRGDRREPIDDRHIREDPAHAIAAAFAVALIEGAREALGLRLRVSGADQAAPDFGRHALDRVRIQRVAPEEIDLLQLREQPGTGVAAGNALHLGDRQELAGSHLVRIELGAAVEMAGDDEHVAANALPAGRGQPIGTTSFHQLDELILTLGQALPEHLLFVGRIDGDGADRALAGVAVRAPAQGEQCDQKKDLGN